MRTLRLAIGKGIALVALLKVAGCGASVAVEDLDDALADAWCDQRVRCGVFETRAECDPLEGAVDPALLAGVSTGTIAYDGEAAAACVEAISHASCDPSSRGQRRQAKSCDSVFSGTLAEGEDCLLDAQCVSRVCVRADCGMECCVGVCAEAAQERAAVGESCVDLSCVEGAWCATDGVCAALHAEGTPCADNAECDYGLACYSLTNELPTCQHLPGEGDGCPTDNVTACNSLGLACNPATEICEPRLYEGSECIPAADRCSRAYLFCDPETRTCARYPTLGAECPQYRCSGEAYCDFDWGSLSGTCVALKQDGDACVLGFECQSGYCAASERCSATPICL